MFDYMMGSHMKRAHGLMAGQKCGGALGMLHSKVNLLNQCLQRQFGQILPPHSLRAYYVLASTVLLPNLI